MTNFLRAVRIALSYRWTFAASIGSALVIAILWGGNIGAVYPFVEASFQGKSLHDWSDEHLAELEAEHGRLLAETAHLKQTSESPQPAVETTLKDKQSELARVEESIRWQTILRERVIDPYLPNDAFQTLMLIVGLFLIGTLLKSVFVVVQTILVGRLSALTAMQLRQTFYRRTLDMELSRFTGEGSGDLMNRFTSDVESVAGGVSELVGKLVREPLKAIVCLVGAAWLCWQLLVLSLILAPLTAWTINWLARRLKRASRRAMEEMSQMYGILDETLQGIKVVKAFTMEAYERRRFRQTNRNYFLRLLRINRYDAVARPLTEILGMTTICLAILAGSYLAINKQTTLFGIPMCSEPPTPGMLVLFFGLLAGMAEPSRKLSEVLSRIQRGAAAADRIFHLIDREPTIVDPPRPVDAARHHRELAFENIQFSYTPARPVIEGVDLRIRFGETVAIVGPNGCGKSTLANLVPRLFDPIEGRVTLDGVDLRDMRLRDLRRQIGLVTQETLLFADTVANNIRYGSPHATDAEVIAAAKQAHAHRFIEERLEHGYDTLVGARGAMLSGGQRQRIALARAILRDPAILILDEATSQVDLESEQVIQRVLEQFTRGRTTLLITHRMSVLALADRIVVMDAGRILDVGEHSELLRRCEVYSRLHDIQFREIA